MNRTIWDTGLTVGAVVGLLVLIALNARGYFHTPEDILFYDRLLVTMLVAWRLRRPIWRHRTTFFFETRVSTRVLLGISLIFVAACLTESRTAAVYLSLAYAGGLVLVTRGGGALRRMAPLLCAIGIMSYPPRHILETLKSWSQAVSLAATRKICEYLLPEVRFAANEVSVGDTLIAFDPECGGFHLVCTMVAMALILGSNMVALAILVKVLIVAGLLAIALNIARIVSTLALTVFGYAEEALFEIHREIGHGFAFLGILAIIGVIRWFEGKLQVKSQVSSVC